MKSLQSSCIARLFLEKVLIKTAAFMSELIPYDDRSKFKYYFHRVYKCLLESKQSTSCDKVPHLTFLLNMRVCGDLL